VRAERLGCEDVREELSARLDHEDDTHLRPLVDDHLAGCTACSSYRDALTSVRRRLRVQAAEATPDMAPDILERLQSKKAYDPRLYLRTVLVAALATALVVGGLTYTERSNEAGVASASEIVAEVRAASRRLTEYRASFDVRERNWHPAVGDRHFDIEIWYRAPEMLRIDTHDRTRYPNTRWPRSDSTVVANETRTFISQAPSCPPSALPECGIGGTTATRLITSRQPLQGRTASITDIVVPLETLASSDAVAVVGAGDELLGRRTIHVRLPYWQAHLIVDAVRPLMSHEIEPRATVDLWLDAENWFPLRFTVTAPDGAQMLIATAEAVSPNVDAGDFVTPRDADTVVVDGFDPGPRPPVVPEFRAGLEPYRSGRTRDGHAVATFSDGLAWLTVTTSDDPPPPSLITAEVVRLPNVGAALYEPATLHQGRVVEMFDGDQRVRLESNLPRGSLLRVADSVAIRGHVVERISTGNSVVERSDLQRVLELPFVATPAAIPTGYTSTSATVTRRDGRISDAILRYSDPENEQTGGSVVITASSDQPYLPPSAERFTTYELDGSIMRWAPERGELEWMDGRTYRSVRVADFDVALALAIARAMT
jgi:outer membrane lipoprotein-sorting protein